MGKKYIVIAEDDKAYGLVYKNKLESEGFDVTVVAQGDLVVPELTKRVPDLLILDLVMPCKNGFEILEDIRKTDKLKNLKVCVTSNLSQQIDREKAKQFGVLKYFVKSDATIFELVDAIKKMVRAT